MRPAVFLDRDGVMVENRPDHVKTFAEIRYLDGAISALERLAASSRAIVVVSNQGAVGRGMVTLETAWDVQREIVRYIERHGGRIDASYLCPHHPDDGCECRKPRPGMLIEAASELDLDLARSYLIGDAVTDLKCAEAAGMRGILVRTGRGAEQELLLDPAERAHWSIVADLNAAVDLVLNPTADRP
jgi:D-glycero-D-manno-heptose 1,7-bisphosphate phosphatase